MKQGYCLTRSYTEKRTGSVNDLDICLLRPQTLPSVTETVRYDYVGYLTLWDIYPWFSSVVEV